MSFPLLFPEKLIFDEVCCTKCYESNDILKYTFFYISQIGGATFASVVLVCMGSGLSPLSAPSLAKIRRNPKDLKGSEKVQGNSVSFPALLACSPPRIFPSERELVANACELARAGGELLAELKLGECSNIRIWRHLMREFACFACNKFASLFPITSSPALTSNNKVGSE